ncbi:MAG TPA: GNAT family N-acetyltransferase [Candidatus Binataceae bacterium]|nr:GNAT family N-acetyltransferase [Candidatus Binataceae bacterium]
MTRQDLEIALSWAAAEGWNPGRNDAECFSAADPNGLLIGILNEEPVVSLSAVAYDSGFGFVGLYIVKPEFRGLGYGVQLWKAGMDYLGTRTLGLDAVLEQRRNYEKWGFAVAYRNIRHEGVGGGEVPAGITPLSKIDFDELTGYDRSLFASRRSAFLGGWIIQPGATAVAKLRGGKLVGYGVMRPCLQGFKIGPLFANDEAIAEELFQAMAASGSGQPVFLDIPETNQAALALAARHQMQPVFETLRMYNRPAPSLDVGRIYGVTSLELG